MASTDVTISDNASIDASLSLLGFSSMDDVTAESLKTAFKLCAVLTHPDHGGKDGDFDEMLTAYITLFHVVKRLSGGRNGLQTIYVDDIKKLRDEQFTQELNNLMNDVFDNIESATHESFNASFNEQFNSVHPSCDPGYDEWFRSTVDTTVNTVPIMADNLNSTFESYKNPIATQSIILHPDEMGFISGKQHGTLLISVVGQPFTSDPEITPTYTDLYAAYTTENMIIDKLPTYVENARTLDSIIAERDTVYQTVANHDMKAIAAYEKKKMDAELQHKLSIAEYFKTASVSQWALTDAFIKQF